MRRLLALFGLMLAGCGMLAPAASGAVTGGPASAPGLVRGYERGFVAAEGGERNAAYDVALVALPDGSLQVTETITHVFPQDQERHGITRDIRVRAGYQDREDVYRYYRMSGLTVSSPTGAPADVDQSDFGAYVHLRIGSADRTVNGQQTYVINYTLAHVVNEIDAERAELVHDLVGVANEEVYDEVTASISAPGG